MTTRRFTAVHDFFADETASHYVAGLGYQARPDDRVLLALLDRWIEEGKVVEGAVGAVVVGKG